MSENENTHKMDYYLFKKMGFIYNAIEDGWNVCKKNDKYIFTKKHEGTKEIYNNQFLSRFMNDNLKSPN